MTKHSQDCVAIRRECRQIWQKLISLFCKLDVGYPETKIYGHPQEIEALSLEIYLQKPTISFERPSVFTLHNTIPVEEGRAKKI